MLTVIEQILLGIALGMDCFSVSLSAGLCLRRFNGKTFILMGLLFGLFQAVMPIIGWGATNCFGDQIEAFDHWIAFALLGFLGIRMIYGSIHSKEDTPFNSLNLSAILLLSVATSIDALAVGVSFTCMQMDTFADILCPVTIIGITSTLMSFAGNTIGIVLGRNFHFPAEIIGGSILLLIGTKILIEHLSK